MIVKKIISESGATEYLILSSYSYNHLTGDVTSKILTEEYVRNSNYIDASYFGTTNSNDIAAIRDGMAVQINEYDNYVTSAFCYNGYVSSVVNLAKRLISIDADCKIWFGFPPMLSACTPAALCYNYYYYNCIYLPIKQQMASYSIWENVEGFYFGQEDLPTWYTAFDENASNDYFSNVIVYCMRYLSELIHNDNKKFMWIPYYRDPTYLDGGLYSNQLGTRLGYIANKTNIFDFVILQPSYYFTEDVGVENVVTVKESTRLQRCVYENGTTIGVSKSSNTEIGAEMEIDNYLHSRYQSYVNNLSTFIIGTVNRPIAFYAGDRNVLMNTSVFSKVKSFFNNGI